MKQYNAEIIAVGTELLLGQIANTNAQWLSNQLASYGINVFYHTVVGDNLLRVQESFQLAQNRSDVIIVTGGLGPTEDDMTREAFQLMTGLHLYEHDKSLEKIKAYFQNQKRVMTPNNRKQARVFQTAKILDNTTGMAPAMLVKHEEKMWIFLPGVPREMKQIFRDRVIPYLLDKTGQEQLITSMNLRFIGIGEAQLEHELKDLIKAQKNPTIAPLAQDDGIVIRLTVKANSLEEAKDKLSKTKQFIFAKVGEYCYGIDEETIERKIVQLLKEKNLKLAAAESITGGMFTNKLISVEGVTEACPGGLITYDERIKRDVLGVSENTIYQYGVVSELCAIEMAEKVRKLFDTDIGISFTGVAGPDQLEGHDVGTVFIAISSKSENQVGKYVFSGNRNQIRNRTTLKGFELLYKLLKS